MYARLAGLASKMNSLQRGDISRINDLIKSVRSWQQAAIWKYASTANPSDPAKEDVDGRMRARGGKCEAAQCLWWGGPMQHVGIYRREIGVTLGMSPA